MNTIQVASGGGCTHLAVVEAIGKVFYPEQEGLEMGQVRCLKCRVVFPTVQAWRDAEWNRIMGVTA